MKNSIVRNAKPLFTMISLTMCLAVYSQVPQPQPKLKQNSSVNDTVPMKGKLPSSATPTTTDQSKLIQQTKIKLPNSYTLQKLTTPFFIPPHVGGDKDFGGHGPSVSCSVNISVSSDKMSIIAHVVMDAKETQSDWTEARGSVDYTIFKCTSGQQIQSIKGPTSSSCSYTDKDHDDDFVLDTYGETGTQAQNSQWDLVNHNESSLVKFYRFVGDIDGDEAGTKTGVQIYFNPIDVVISGNPMDEVQLNVPALYKGCGSNTCASSASANFLAYYGITRDCNTMKAKMESSSNLINLIGQLGGDIGIDPNSVRDRLNEIKSGFTLDEINNSSVISTIINQLNNKKPVIALTGWGSKTVLFDFIRSDDNVSLNPNSMLHFIVVDGYNRQTGVFSIITNYTTPSNGGASSRVYLTSEYLVNTILWHPENFAIETALYVNQVKPGKIIY